MSPIHIFHLSSEIISSLYRSKSRTLIQVLILLIYSIFMESPFPQMSYLLKFLSKLMSMAKWLDYPPATQEVRGLNPDKSIFFLFLISFSFWPMAK